jgi:hypothetical protein
MLCDFILSNEEQNVISLLSVQACVFKIDGQCQQQDAKDVNLDSKSCGSHSWESQRSFDE